jgi:hypothetical protein
MQMPPAAGGTGVQPLIQKRFHELAGLAVQKNPVTQDSQ